MITTDNIVEIQNLLTLYTYFLDERKFSIAHEIFTDDATYDMSAFGPEKAIGLPAIVELMRKTSHPLLHTALSPLVREDPDGTVRVISRCMAAVDGGSVGVATYHDVVRRTPQGWRIAERLVTPRTREAIPGDS